MCSLFFEPSCPSNQGTFIFSPSSIIFAPYNKVLNQLNTHFRFCFIIGSICTSFFVLEPEYGAAEESNEPVVEEAVAATNPAASDQSMIDGITFAERSQKFLTYSSLTRSKAPLYPKAAASKYLARLVLNTDTSYALMQLDLAASAVLKKGQPTGGAENPHALDPFDKHALVHTWLICQNQMPPALTAKIKAYVALWRHREWKGYGAMNYRLMMDGSGFLAAEQWPDLLDADGLKAEEIQAATRQRLLSYFTDIVHHNFPEYESPTYYGIDLAAMKMIADFAKDPVVKQRATLTLDWMMLSLACSWNQGYNTASCGRAKYWVSTNTSPDEMDDTAAIAWLYFGGNRPVRPRGMNEGGSIWFACPGTYQPPQILTEIANDRGSPVLYHSSVILGKNESVRCTIYHTPSYSLASQFEYLSAPTSGLYKETRREMLKWISDKSSSTFCPLQENPRRPYKLQENIRNAFGYGESPFGASLQDNGTLVGVYAVSAAYPFYKLYAPFSQSGAILKRIEKQGWVICHGGSMCFAFKPVKPYTWGKPEQGEDVLWSDARVNGWVLETSPLAPFAGGGVATELDRFTTALLAKTKLEFDESNPELPHLTFMSLNGDRLDITCRPHGQPYKGQHKVNGQAIDYFGFPLLGNQWVNQNVNGDILSLKHGALSLTYNFSSWTRSP